jgi:hypothetical protein
MSEASRKKRFRVVGIRSDGTRAILATGLPTHEALDVIRFQRANELAGGEVLPLQVAFERTEIEEEEAARPPDEKPA